MWRFDRWSSRDVVRVGRSTVEHWRAAGTDLLLQQRSLLPSDRTPTLEDLEAAIAALLTHAPSRKIDLVLESAWLPVVLLDTGSRLLSNAEINALARHRFQRHHDTPSDPVAQWHLRADHRAGERWSLAYGLPDRVLTAATSAGKFRGVSWARIMPSLDWAAQRHAARTRTGTWIVFVEEDRQLVLRLAAGRAVGLHAAMPASPSETAPLTSIAAEEARLGIAPGSDAIDILHWSLHEPSTPASRLTWHDLAHVSGRGFPFPRRTAAMQTT